MSNTKSFEHKLHHILIEGILPRHNPSQGSEAIPGNIPAEFAKSEPEVKIEFDWAKPEQRTHEYPGSPGGVSITRVILTNSGKELDIDQLPEGITKYFEEIATEYLTDMENRALGDYEDSLDARRDEISHRPSRGI